MNTKKIEKKLIEFSNRNKVDTIQVAIYYKGEVVSISNKHPEKTYIFEIASITKVITATAILIACYENKLSLSTRLSSIFKLPFIVNETKRNIEINELLTHSSGLPNLPINFLQKMMDCEKSPYSVLHKELVFDYLATNTDEMIKKYCYSNFGYGLLGLIIEEIYECSFESFLASKIFHPMGMINSSLNKPKNKSMLIKGFDNNSKFISTWEDNCLFGGGAILSTTSDFILYLSHFFSETSFYKILNNMLIPQTKKMGIGWHRSSFIGRMFGFGNYYWHNGLSGGYSSYSAISKKDRNAFILLANKGISIDNLGLEIITHL